MGTLDGLVRTMSGGVVPGGMRRRIVCETPVTWDIAVLMFTLGWNRSFTRPTPLELSERTSNRSSTLLSVAISENEVIFDAISAAFKPL